jgi:hypothetical protein
MPVLEVLTSSALGSLLGMRHALEPDHLAAVSTLVTSERSSRRAAMLGACWGIGHTFSLVVVGATLVLLRAEMPPRVAGVFELAVAVMLIVLGLRTMIQAATQVLKGPGHIHRHGMRLHRHAGDSAHVHIGQWTFAQRPLLVGAIHGLAGSGALTALVLATLPSASARLAYMALFGLGSTLGMAALSGLLGWPLARLGARPVLARGIALTVGGVSACVGVAWGYPVVLQLVQAG